jgi:hypothetical protein
MVCAAAAGFAEPVLFHSPLDDGAVATTPLILEDGGWGSLNLYLQTSGAASSDPSKVCVSAEGGEICGVSLTLTASGALYFMSFLPEPSANVVYRVTGSSFRANILDSVAPTVGTHRYGTLDLVALPGSCPTGACVVTVESAEVIEADLGVSTATFATGSAIIASVPEAPRGIGLVAGCLLLAALVYIPRRVRLGSSPSRASIGILLLVAFGQLVAGPAGASLGPCGDVDVDGILSSADLYYYRTFLVDPTGSPLGPDGEARCRVSLDSTDCDLLGAVVLSRRLAVPLRGPRIEGACSAVVPLDLVVGLAPGEVKTVVDALGEVLETTAPDGSVFRITFPAGAVTLPGGVVVSMRAISALGGFDGSGGFIAGIELEPDGLVLAKAATLRIEFANPIDPTQLAAVAYEGSGGAAGFVPIFLETAGAVSAVEIPINHFSGVAAVGASADELASTPPASAIDDAPYQQELASILKYAVAANLLGFDILQEPDVRDSLAETMRDWLRQIRDRASTPTEFNSCSDVAEVSRTALTWATRDQQFGTDIGTSTDPADQAVWNAAQAAVGNTYDVLANQYNQAAADCANSELDACSKFNARRDTEKCHRQVDGILLSMGRQPVDPAEFDMSALCSGVPNRMVFERQDTSAQGPFEACPADAAFVVTSTVADSNGNPITIFDPIAWGTSNSSILGVTPHGDYATVTPAGGLGSVVLDAVWTACPELPASTNAFVGVAPRLVGTWQASGFESMTGCEDPDENYPPTSGLVSGEIEAQITNLDGSVTFNIFGLGWGGVATLSCGDLPGFSGSDPYVFEYVCEEDATCQGSGISNYDGQMLSKAGPPGQRVATSFSIEWTSQDLVGDTCLAEGAGTLSRVGH